MHLVVASYVVCVLGGGVLDRRHVLDIMHGRSRKTIDPRIPTLPGRGTSGFHQPGRCCLHQARSAARCWASRMKHELHPAKNLFLKADFLHKDDSVNDLIYYLVWPLAETAMALLCDCLVGALPYTHYVIDHPPCAEGMFSPHEHDLTRPLAVVTAKKQKRYPGCLAHAMRVVLYI